MSFSMVIVFNLVLMELIEVKMCVFDALNSVYPVKPEIAAMNALIILLMLEEIVSWSALADFIDNYKPHGPLFSNTVGLAM